MAGVGGRGRPKEERRSLAMAGFVKSFEGTDRIWSGETRERGYRQEGALRCESGDWKSRWSSRDVSTTFPATPFGLCKQVSKRSEHLSSCFVAGPASHPLRSFPACLNCIYCEFPTLTVPLLDMRFGVRNKVCDDHPG